MIVFRTTDPEPETVCTVAVLVTREIASTETNLPVSFTSLVRVTLETAAVVVFGTSKYVGTNLAYAVQTSSTMVAASRNLFMPPPRLVVWSNKNQPIIGSINPDW